MKWWKWLWAKPSHLPPLAAPPPGDPARAQHTVCEILTRQGAQPRDDLVNLAYLFFQGWMTDISSDTPDNPTLALGAQLGVDSSAIGWNLAWETATRILSRPDWIEPEPGVMNLALQYVWLNTSKSEERARPRVAMDYSSLPRSNRARMTACFIMAQQNECTRDEIQNLAREFLAGWLIDPAEPPGNPAPGLGIHCGIDCSAIGWDLAQQSAARILSRPDWVEPEPGAINLAIQYMAMRAFQSAQDRQDATGLAASGVGDAP
jgi:hypothetical protein